MGKDLILSGKKDAFNRIKKFILTQDITLTAEEEIIMARWIHCDVLLKCKRFNEDEIIAQLTEKFSISSATARKDILQTQRLFALSRRFIKGYYLPLHIQRIDEDIERIRKIIFKKYKDEATGEECESFDAKELAALAKLHETYTYSVNSLPNEDIADKNPPPIFNFILAAGQNLSKPLADEEALKAADEYLQQNKDGIYE